MSLDEHENTDEFIVTAEQIFEFCGTEISSTLCVDTLMDKYAPFVKTNKAEYSYLRSLLDPNQCNPDITVTELATTLNKYSENQKVNTQLDESFNLKTGLVPHDSDSGISTDGFQLLEELQSELREKAQVTQQLRRQLADCDAVHEEALEAAAAETRTLREHLNMLREENSSLSHFRHDYEDVCEQLSSSERALDEARGQLEGAKRRTRVLTEQVAMLENEKLSLQELLSQSKRECHHMNEMYAARHKALLEQNESLRTERAELAARASDLDRDLQQMLREKVILEMELKDMLNKSNTHLRVDRSIDVSYTDDQMLTALDTLNAECNFTQENRQLDEESFVDAFIEDQGRPTNLSLFDEIRLSFCNVSRNDLKDLNCSQDIFKSSEMDTSFITVGTQTNPDNIACFCKKCPSSSVTIQMKSNAFDYIHTDDFFHPSDINSYNVLNVSTQTIDVNNNDTLNKSQFTITKNKSTNTSLHVLEVFKDIEVMNFGTQTEAEPIESHHNNNNVQICIECSKCVECDRLNKYSNKLVSEIQKSNKIVQEIQRDMNVYEENLNLLKRFVDEGNEHNAALKSIVESLQARLNIMEGACKEQNEENEYCACSAETQTECDYSSVSTQTELPCPECVRRPRHRSLRRYLWDSLKWLFQLFAVVCFACAVWALCSVTRRPRGCHPTPWWWMHAHELLDLFLTIEYVAEVPM